jgi:hypothetical protein
MEIGGLLNPRQTAVTEAQLRQHQLHAMQLDSQSYALGQSQNQINQNQHAQLHDHNSISYHAMHQQPHSQSQIYSADFNATQQNMKQEAHLDDTDYDPLNQTQKDNTERKWSCPECSKRFARKSDLSRHGMVP